ncbi:hypothetical protein KM043_005761 [Ampulex compressa]|nr:hypothetical protein KM043_005761 [Ampulex compressa]
MSSIIREVQFQAMLCLEIQRPTSRTPDSSSKPRYPLEPKSPSKFTLLNPPGRRLVLRREASKPSSALRRSSKDRRVYNFCGIKISSWPESLWEEEGTRFGEEGGFDLLPGLFTRRAFT